MKVLGLVMLIGVIVLSGCTTTQKGAVVGGVAGGGLGAIIGHQSGHAGEGAAIGAAVGTLGGVIVGERMDKRFCPICGRRFGASKEYCPFDGEKLELIER